MAEEKTPSALKFEYGVDLWWGSTIQSYARMKLLLKGQGLERNHVLHAAFSIKDRTDTARGGANRKVTKEMRSSLAKLLLRYGLRSKLLIHSQDHLCSAIKMNVAALRTDDGSIGRCRGLCGQAKAGQSNNSLAVS